MTSACYIEATDNLVIFLQKESGENMVDGKIWSMETFKPQCIQSSSGWIPGPKRLLLDDKELLIGHIRCI